MKQEIEIEFKMMLTENEYNNLLTRCSFPKQAITQTNYYFETEAFLLKQKQSALRIRMKNDTYTLTLKQPHKQGILETHQSLTKNEAMSWINNQPVINNEMTNYLEMLNIPINDLKFYGSLTTERRQFEQNNIIYVLDKSFYNNIVDYELEIEAPTQMKGEESFQSLLDEFNIIQKDTVTKIERFFNTRT